MKKTYFITWVANNANGNVVINFDFQENRLEDLIDILKKNIMEEHKDIRLDNFLIKYLVEIR